MEGPSGNRRVFLRPVSRPAVFLCYYFAMPNMKSTFARISGIDAGQLQSTAARMKKITFGMNSEEQVVAVDVEPNRLTAEVIVRREREVPAFDETKGALVREKRYEYRSLFFVLDTELGVVSTPGAKRDISLFAELLKRAGATAVEIADLIVDLPAWVREFMKMYDTAQLGQLVIDKLYVEPKLIGRYSAKTVDNRLDLKAIEDLPGMLKSVRFSFYHYDARRGIEARADGVLNCSSSEEEELDTFFREMVPVFLRHGIGEE